MVTRVRVEAEGRTTDEVTRSLEAAFDQLVSAQPPIAQALWGEQNQKGAYPGLADAQAGEFVIERFYKDTGGGAGHGVLFYRGRMTSHFGKPNEALKLGKRQEDMTIVHQDGPPQGD